MRLSTYDNQSAQRLADVIDQLTADLKEDTGDFERMLESAIEIVKMRRRTRVDVLDD